MEQDCIPQLREAIQRGDFRRATRLWEDYVAWLGEEIRAGRANQSQMSETHRLVEWGRQAAITARAHCQRRLNSLLSLQRAATAYRRLSDRPKPTVRTSL